MVHILQYVLTLIAILHNVISIHFVIHYVMAILRLSAVYQIQHH